MSPLSCRPCDVVHVLDIYRTMEYVDGDNITGLVQKGGKFKEDVVKSFLRQILEGLKYIHSQNITHKVTLSCHKARVYRRLLTLMLEFNRKQRSR